MRFTARLQAALAAALALVGAPASATTFEKVSASAECAARTCVTARGVVEASIASAGHALAEHRRAGPLPRGDDRAHA